MFIKPAILLAGAISVLTLVACSSNDPAQSKDAVAATVNGEPISERLVSMMLKQRSDLGREAGPEARKAFIDRLAMQLVISQEAIKKGLDKSADVADQVQMIRQSVLVDAFVQDYLKNNPVSDDAIKAEYEKIKAQEAGKEYKARHILVDSEAEAKDIIAKLNKDPKAFEALAKAKSKDPGSKAKGGELGWFDPRSMVPEFGNAVTKLAKGKFTETPVKSQFGYHVILLEDTRDKEIVPLEQVKARLKQQMQEQNLQKLFDDMKAKAKIEIAQAPSAAPAKDAKAAAPAKAEEPAKK